MSSSADSNASSYIICSSASSASSSASSCGECVSSASVNRDLIDQNVELPFRDFCYLND